MLQREYPVLHVSRPTSNGQVTVTQTSIGLSGNVWPLYHLLLEEFSVNLDLLSSYQLPVIYDSERIVELKNLETAFVRLNGDFLLYAASSYGQDVAAWNSSFFMMVRQNQKAAIQLHLETLVFTIANGHTGVDVLKMMLDVTGQLHDTYAQVKQQINNLVMEFIPLRFIRPVFPLLAQGWSGSTYTAVYLGNFTALQMSYAAFSESTNDPAILLATAILNPTLLETSASTSLLKLQALATAALTLERCDRLAALLSKSNNVEVSKVLRSAFRMGSCPLTGPLLAIAANVHPNSYLDVFSNSFVDDAGLSAVAHLRGMSSTILAQLNTSMILTRRFVDAILKS